MEDTKSLLTMVLQKIFQDNLKVLDDTYQLIYSYNGSKKEKTEYEKTLKTICELMNDKLPPQILVYLLTLVDLPKEDGGHLPIIEKMQKTHNCLPESVRPHLLCYLNGAGRKEIAMENDGDEDKEETVKPPTPVKRAAESKFLKPVKRPRTRKRVLKNAGVDSLDENLTPTSLQDIAANYVVKNEVTLKKIYKKRQTDAWKLINSNSLSGQSLQQCYEVVKDLNKKTKLLRMIENDNITADIFFDEYRESDVFLKEKHMYDAVYRDPFDVTEELTEGIKQFLGK